MRHNTLKQGEKVPQAAKAISQTTGSEGCKCGLLDNQVLLLAEINDTRCLNQMTSTATKYFAVAAISFRKLQNRTA
ncbi:hypothetical protein [Pelagimonas sp. KU-00592-HH]|uniref:hypothetical protein n=1 Tax=Pelagimonas sp. KU-00592-HH TaxID=3127651 RepID=UPI00333E3B82